MKMIRCGVVITLTLGLFASTARSEDSLDLPIDSNKGVLTPVATDANANGQPVVEHLTVTQWVERDDQNRVSGRVVAIAKGQLTGVSNADVTLLSPGSEILMAKTDADGKFIIAGVESGIYALTARSADHFACCAMHVVDSTMESADEIVTDALITAAAVDFTDIQTALIRYLPPVFDPVGRTIQDADLSGLKPYVATTDNYKVRQRLGGLDGFIIRPGAERANLTGAQQSNVFLFQDGVEVARTMTEPNGHFRFDDAVVGDYGLIAVGPDGVGSIGFELVADEAPSTVSVRGSDGTVLTQYASAACCNAVAMQIAPPTEVVGTLQENVISDTVISEQVIGEQIIGTDVGGAFFGDPVAGFGGGGFAPAGGGLAGGGGGFAGGGLGGAGIGRLAALGGIAAAIAIAASDDDDNVVAPPAVASPATPTSSDSDSDSDDDDDSDD